jgi:uncharacterized protein YjiS (DUF1127 family)
MQTRELDHYIDRLVTEVARWKDPRRSRQELNELRYVLTRHLRDMRLLRHSVQAAALHQPDRRQWSPLHGADSQRPEPSAAEWLVTTKTNPQYL